MRSDFLCDAPADANWCADDNEIGILGCFRSRRICFVDQPKFQCLCARRLGCRRADDFTDQSAMPARCVKIDDPIKPIPISASRLNMG